MGCIFQDYDHEVTGVSDVLDGACMINRIAPSYKTLFCGIALQIYTLNCHNKILCSYCLNYSTGFLDMASINK